MKIDFLNSDHETRARKTTVVIAAVFTLFVGCLAAFGARASFHAANQGGGILADVSSWFSFKSIRQLALDNPNQAEDPFDTPDGRINILLLGVGGEGHDGSQLSDTIILASLDRSNNKIGMVSIPRDLAYPLGGGQYQKINALNAKYENAYPGEGAKRTAEDFEKLLNIRIDRVVRIDFKGFEQFVDALGGLDIDVERSFTDYRYPTDEDGPDPFKVQTITFKKGVEHMAGKRVLTYARSRHGNNGEGSDFARSRRQQLVLEALRKKLFSLGVLSNPSKISELWNTISSHVQTTMSAWDAVKLIPVATHFSNSNITTHVLNDVLVDGPDYMLFPRKSDWSEIRAIVDNPFVTKEEAQAEVRPTEKTVLEVKNGTLRTGYAASISSKLEDVGYTISSTGNATARNYQKSVIFDLTNGAKATELAKLKKLLNANVSASPPVGSDVIADNGVKEHVSATSTNFLIILGDSSVSLLNN